MSLSTGRRPPSGRFGVLGGISNKNPPLNRARRSRKTVNEIDIGNGILKYTQGQKDLKGKQKKFLTLEEIIHQDS